MKTDILIIGKQGSGKTELIKKITAGVNYFNIIDWCIGSEYYSRYDFKKTFDKIDFIIVDEASNIISVFDLLTKPLTERPNVIITSTRFAEKDFKNIKTPLLIIT